jgi:hypothetical protein
MTVATERLARYIAAETEILQSQEVRADLGDGRGYRMLRMADLETVRRVIAELQAQVRAETSAGRGFGYAVADLSGD